MTASLGNFQNGSYGSNLDGFVYPQFLFDPRRPPTTTDIFPAGTRWLDNSVSPKVIYETTGAGVWASVGVFSAINVSGLATFSGGINTNPTIVAAGASPRTANSRSGQVTFSGVSIAAGATQSFVINNTAIPAVGSVILYTLVGATSGAALTIQSVTNVAGVSSTIVVQNGTGATTTIANITFTFLILN